MATVGVKGYCCCTDVRNDPYANGNPNHAICSRNDFATYGCTDAKVCLSVCLSVRLSVCICQSDDNNARMVTTVESHSIPVRQQIIFCCFHPINSNKLNNKEVNILYH